MLRDKPYLNLVIILQSSGTGKSRMVHELSESVFTLPFNLRPDSENKDIAYPPPDTGIRDYLSPLHASFGAHFPDCFDRIGQNMCSQTNHVGRAGRAMAQIHGQYSELR